MVPFSTHKWRRGGLSDGLAMAVLALVAAAALLTFQDYGLGWDDYTHAEYGELLLALFSSGFSDRRALWFVNLYMYGGGYDLLAALAAKFLPVDPFEVRRLIGGVVGLIGLVTTWRLARRLGGPTAGLVALALLATCPLFYGHMFINPKDVPFAVAMIVLLYASVRAFQDYPEAEPATLALFGLGLGLALGTRIIGVIAVVYVFAGFGLIVVHQARANGLRSAVLEALGFMRGFIPALILAYLVMGLIWPWGVVEVLNPLRAIEYFSYFFEKPWKEMFDGALISVPDMPRTYLPTLFALMMPEIFIALGVAGLLGVCFDLLHRDTDFRHRAALLTIVAAATMPILIAIATKPALYNGVRHFIFTVPPLAILGGLAGAWMLDRVSGWRPLAGALAVAAFLIGIALPIVDMIRLHPYQYTSFNAVSGGVRAADDRYMLDYWGLAFKQAAQELREELTERLESPPTNRQTWKIAVCGPHRPAAVELGPEFETTWDAKGADFALMLGEFYCAKLNAPVLVEVEREGVVYARVYDIRDRTVTSLFTIPPP